MNNCIVLLCAVLALSLCANAPCVASDCQNQFINWAGCVPYTRYCKAPQYSQWTLKVNSVDNYPTDWVGGCGMASDAQYAATAWKTSPYITQPGDLPTITPQECQFPDSDCNRDSDYDGVNLAYFGTSTHGAESVIICNLTTVLEYHCIIDWTVLNMGLRPPSPCDLCEGSQSEGYLARVFAHEFGHFYLSPSGGGGFDGEATCVESIMNSGAVFQSTCELSLNQEHVYSNDGEAASAMWGPLAITSIDNLEAIGGVQQVALSWTAQGMAGDEMIVWRSSDGSVVYDNVAEVVYQQGTNQYEYIDTGLLTSGRHYYRVTDITGSVGTDPVWATPAAPNAPPVPVPPPGIVNASSVSIGNGQRALLLSNGSSFANSHELRWGTTEALGNSIAIQPANYGRYTFSGQQGQLYYVAAVGLRSPHTSMLGPMNSFVIPVSAHLSITNGGFEAGQYGWHPIVNPGSELNLGVSARSHGFTPGFVGAISGNNSAYVRCTASPAGEARRKVNFASPLAKRYPPGPPSQVIRFSFKAYFQTGAGDALGAADWRLDARVAYLDAQLGRIGDSGMMTWQGVGPGVQSTGVTWKSIPVGQPPANTDYLQVEAELQAHAKSGTQASEAWVMIDNVELRAIDQSKSIIAMHHGGPAITPVDPPAQIGGCPANTDLTWHPSGTTGPPAYAGDYWLEVVLKDPLNNPIPDVADVKLDFNGCNSPHYNRPTVLNADSPTDANGATRFHQGLAFGGADPCQFKLKVAGHDWITYNGLRSIDINGDGCLANGDFGAFQAAYVGDGPAYLCDLNLDNHSDCGLTDFSIFQSHYTTAAPHGPGCPGARGSGASVATSGVNEPDDGVESEIMSNDLTNLYLHIGERAAEGAPPPSVPPDSAVTSIGHVDPEGQEVTIWLFASGFGELRGVHVRWELPGNWDLQEVEETLPGQLFAHPDGFWRARGEFMSAFDCVHGRDGRVAAVGRFDVHVTEPGSIRLNDANSIARVVDCRGQLTVLRQEQQIIGARHTSGSMVKNEEPAAKSLKRLSPLATRGRSEFILNLDVTTEVTAKVYDVKGRLIALLHDREALSMGTHRLAWDGSSARSGRVASGVYTIEILAGEKRFVERTIVLR